MAPLSRGAGSLATSLPPVSAKSSVEVLPPDCWITARMLVPLVSCGLPSSSRKTVSSVGLTISSVLWRPVPSISPPCGPLCARPGSGQASITTAAARTASVRGIGLSLCWRAGSDPCADDKLCASRAAARVSPPFKSKSVCSPGLRARRRDFPRSQDARERPAAQSQEQDRREQRVEQRRADEAAEDRHRHWMQDLAPRLVGAEQQRHEREARAQRRHEDRSEALQAA